MTAMSRAGGSVAAGRPLMRIDQRTAVRQADGEALDETVEAMFQASPVRLGEVGEGLVQDFVVVVPSDQMYVQVEAGAAEHGAQCVQTRVATTVLDFCHGGAGDACPARQLTPAEPALVASLADQRCRQRQAAINSTFHIRVVPDPGPVFRMQPTSTLPLRIGEKASAPRSIRQFGLEQKIVK